MKILAIETSCDETAVAVVEDGTKTLSGVVVSSLPVHAQTGGIIPENAARKQIDYIVAVLDTTLKKAFPKTKNIKKAVEKIDAIAVTCGPGLVGSLLVGIEFAKTLALLWKKPLIPVNHLVAHIYAPLLTQTPPMLPAIALVDFKNHGQLAWLGGTRDDAAGEAFDKCARLLGLPYPGGPAISNAADNYFRQNKSDKLTLFPRPLIKSNDLDLSFSGLKTAVLNYTQNNTDTNVAKVAAEIQEAIVDCLVSKTIKAISKYHVKTVIVGGGVSANKRLKEKLVQAVNKLSRPIALHVTVPEYSTDNAAIIATCAYYNNAPKSWDQVNANPQLTITDKP